MGVDDLDLLVGAYNDCDAAASGYCLYCGGHGTLMCFVISPVKREDLSVLSRYQLPKNEVRKLKEVKYAVG